MIFLYLKPYFLSWWCYITCEWNDYGLKCVFKLENKQKKKRRFSFSCVYIREGGGLNQSTQWKKERRVVYICGQSDCSARPQIAKTPSQLGHPRREPGQTRNSQPWSMLCCAIPGWKWLKWLCVHFYLFGVFIECQKTVQKKKEDRKGKKKKMNWADKQMQQPFVFIVWTTWVYICASVYAHVT